MNCSEVETGSLAEKYVAGDLDDAEATQFEEHFFACDQCFEEVRTLRALRGELSSLRTEPPASTSQYFSVRNWRWCWRWRWAFGAAAALTVLLAVLIVSLQQGRMPASHPAETADGGQRASALVELSQFVPPRYDPPVLRGASAPDMDFRGAMDLYRRGEFSQAIPLLERAAQRGSASLDSRFFLGVCHLVSGRAGEAVDSFRAVVAMGDSPYLEESHFYLAKAFLSQRDAAGAVRELDAVIRLAGDMENEARVLRQKVLDAGGSGLK